MIETGDGRKAEDVLAPGRDLLEFHAALPELIASAKTRGRTVLAMWLEEAWAGEPASEK